MVDAEVLRPRRWVEENGLAVGGRVRFLSDELELEGNATLTGLDPCPPVATGDGEVVTGRFVTRRVNQIVRMVFTNGTVLEGTTVHPIWSPERNNWVPMGDFKPGDFVLARSGWLEVAETELLTRSQPVYNLEINAEHVYEVTDDAILVHNAYSSGAPNKITGDALAAMRKEFNAVKPQAWIDEAAKNAQKYTADQLARMKKGLAPIGADGFPMEIHHRTPLAESGSNLCDNFDFLTRTDQRLGPNYKLNHPNLP